MTYIPFIEKELKPDKGLKGGSCNRRACQAPNALYYNKATDAYYCAECADRINRANGDMTMKAYGVKDLCTLEKP